MEDFPLSVAGREIPDPIDRVRRYCGLPWSGGPPEVWAWPYFDAVSSDPVDQVTPVDVMCAAAVHPGIAREDLWFYRRHAEEVGAWLAGVPTGVRLWEAPEGVVSHIASLRELGAPSLSLLQNPPSEATAPHPPPRAPSRRLVSRADGTGAAHRGLASVSGLHAGGGARRSLPTRAVDCRFTDRS